MGYVVTFSALAIARWQNFHHNPTSIIKNVAKQDSASFNGIPFKRLPDNSIVCFVRENNKLAGIIHIIFHDVR